MSVNKTSLEKMFSEIKKFIAIELEVHFLKEISL